MYTPVVGPVEGGAALALAGGFTAALVGHGHLRVFGLGLVACAGVAVFAMLVVNRVVWRDRDVVERRLLLAYCDRLENVHGQKWSVRSWVQEVDVQPNGDVRQRISFTVVALCEVLYFCTFHDRANWEWPRRHRRRVQAHVRSVEVRGEGGTRYDFTTSWLDNGVLKMVVHLHGGVPLGGEVSLSVDMFWPAKCLPLMRGDRADEFLASFAEPVPFAQYVIRLPVGERASFEKVGMLTEQDDCSLTRELNQSGHLETTLTVRDLPAYRKFGVRLDLA
ncbi:hypothetical protein [Saccharothrix saharensis]|uniref:hypothetical protein n=1 Tax=Saccharothrix saharensis TaxID=571190 RepID=UPI00114E5A87|nr:hypothetical protein [Saccharothrix saharensis]